MKKLTAKDYKTTKWSGGTTTELYIYPENSLFSKRDFEFRLSIATINISSSDFTLLQGIDRTLLLLEGELKLIHEGHHQSFLMPFSQDTFKGDWNTHCIGIGKDFNLMTKDQRGKVSVYKNDILLTSEAKHFCVYCYDGEIKLVNESLKSNELCVIHSPNVVDLIIDGTAIVVEIG